MVEIQWFFLSLSLTVHGFELIWGTMTSYLISGVPIKACGVTNFCQWTVSVEGQGLGLPIFTNLLILPLILYCLSQSRQLNSSLHKEHV